MADGFPGSSAREARRRSARSLTQAGLIEMAAGVFYYFFYPSVSRSWHLYGGIAIVAGGLVLLGVAYRIRRSARQEAGGRSLNHDR